VRVLVFLVAIAATTTVVAGQSAAADAIRPFTIQVSDAVLADLKSRLAAARIPEPLQGDGWTYGTDLGYLRRLVAYWRDGFNWREQERRLNQFEQFTTTIDGQRLHFVHRRSKHANALPLLITHGWPGSFVEFTKIIGPLTDPEAHGGVAADAFHVVMPSIPGFAFSEAPREPGFNPARIAALEAALMARLGYTRYGVQGGDWGSIISTQVALDRTRARAAADPPGVSERGDWLPANPGNEATNARRRAERFAGRSGGVDRREVSDVVRLQRRS
jgi:hypothetical protein